MTLYLPWPLDGNNPLNFPVRAGFQPLILAGSVRTALGDISTIAWSPGSQATYGLLDQLFPKLSKFGVNALPVRLTVRGNFILSLAPVTQLDADAFLTATGFQLPTGDGRPGGDLDFWFVLVPWRPAYGRSIRQVRLDALDPVYAGIGTENF